MKTTKNRSADTLTISVEGRLDTTTAPALEAEVNDSLSGLKELVFDFKDLEYVSSAGLRVLIFAQNTMSEQGGEMRVINSNEDIMEIFEITGFSDILNIE